MIECIYEDNHLLALNKPANLLTQPSGTGQESLESIAKQWLKKKYGKPGNVFLEAVHRLDKQVSGVVLFAKTSKAVSRMKMAMREKHCEKIYRAMVEGEMKEECGVFEDFLIQEDYRAKIAKEHCPGSKKAVLRYQAIAVKNGNTLVEIELETGRYHQIRAQFSHRGYPILGDVKYGGKKWPNQEGIALQHIRLTVPHPITGNKITFELRPKF